MIEVFMITMHQTRESQTPHFVFIVLIEVFRLMAEPRQFNKICVILAQDYHTRILKLMHLLCS